MALSSCEKMLDQSSPSTFDDSVVYANYTLAEQTIFSIHIAFGEQNSYRGRFLPWYGFNTDIEWYNSPKSDERTQIAAYDVRLNNGQLNDSKNPFADMYSAVERANLTIEGLRKYGNVEKDADMAYLLGEALTLRAMIYYDLVKAWGDVPARFSSLTTETLFVPKSSRDVIFKQLLADLDEAIPYLPYPGQSTQTARTDRVNKVFAEGLYARIALMASGYAIRPDDGMVGTGDLGTVRLSSDADLSKEVLYPKALRYQKDAISSKTCSLEADYETLWRNFNAMDLTAGKEFLFNIPFGANDQKARGRWNYTFAVKCENSSIFGYNVNQGGQAGPTPTTWFMYDPRDTRRDVTCVNYKLVKNVLTPSGINNWYFGKYRFNWMTLFPYTGGNDDGIKPVVMRYADVLLMAAEIANELQENDYAKDCLLEVRKRAFKGNEAAAEAYVDALSGKDAFFEAIVRERALEFCGEFLRKADLIRWNRLYSALNAEKANLRNLASLQGDYAALSGNVWYRESEDGESLEFYGLGAGETSAPEGNWEVVSEYVSTTKLKDADIDYLFSQPDEDQLNRRQFWPIFQYIVDTSQKTLVNDYNY
jgi:hypothetical protein